MIRPIDGEEAGERMHAAIWDGPDLRELADPQALGADELRRAIAFARDVTKAVREHWFDLTPEELRNVVALADAIDAQMRRAEEAAVHIRKRSMVAALGSAWRAFVATVQSAGANTPLMFVAVNEAVHLRDAVREQQRKQYATEAAITEAAVNADPDWIAQHELREAHDAYAAGDFVALTPRELRERAQRKAQAEA
jgi:hypothetical protein